MKTDVSPRPSSAFEKRSGHERSKTLMSAEGKSRGRAREGAFPPSRKGGSGDLPRENFIFPDVRRNDFYAL